MSSECLPMTMAETISMETSSSRAISARRRVESRIPPRPSTRERGIPDTCVNSAVSPSTGSVATSTMLSGARRAISGASDLIRPAFTVNSSSRRMPGAADGAGRHHDELRALDVLQRVRAGEEVAVAADGRRLHDVQHLSARETGLDVDEEDVRDALLRDEEPGVGPDVAAADDAHLGHEDRLSARLLLNVHITNPPLRVGAIL